MRLKRLFSFIALLIISLPMEASAETVRVRDHRGSTSSGDVGTSSSGPTAQEHFIGELRVFGFNFCPKGWANADGQLLPIAQNQALFSLFGTMYGGNGRTTFGLPDLRGRVIVGDGQGPGLSDYRQGQKGGSETTSASAGRSGGVDQTTDFSGSHDNRQPYTTMNVCVALQGIFPSRN